MSAPASLAGTKDERPVGVRRLVGARKMQPVEHPQHTALYPRIGQRRIGDARRDVAAGAHREVDRDAARELRITRCGTFVASAECARPRAHDARDLLGAQTLAGSARGRRRQATLAAATGTRAVAARPRAASGAGSATPVAGHTGAGTKARVEGARAEERAAPLAPTFTRGAQTDAARRTSEHQAGRAQAAERLGHGADGAERLDHFLTHRTV